MSFMKFSRRYIPVWVLAPALLACSVSPAPAPDFSRVNRLLAAAVKDGAFPGCAAAVGSSSGSYWAGGFGSLALDTETAGKLSLPAAAVPGSGTLYDLASLTKVIGTTSVVAALIQEKKLALEDTVASHLPAFAPASLKKKNRELKKKVTVEQLLLHTSGLPSWKPLYKTCKSYRELLKAILETPLEAEPGSLYRYSDLGFILLGELAAKTGGKPLAALEQELVFKPLGMKNTLRNPPASRKKRIAPTELDKETKEYIHGKVHDENARAGEGITGHAGLFSTSSDLSRLARELLLALRGKSRRLDRKVIENFIRCKNSPGGSSRALGWDTPSKKSSVGELASRNSFGHTGFTGTSIWIDPENDLYIILLSNRVHPTRQNRKISNVRRAFANEAVSALNHYRKRAP
ncbi:MAG: serine hydrolase domain-containing protein [Planctomycetota bacterium]|nr:serine hydrolase domain-containing protein [Planctomycetota bacterium]